MARTERRHRIADGIDQDCDGVDTCFKDADGDGWAANGVVSGTTPDCSGPGEVLTGVAAGDCDDADPSVHPEAEEVVDNGVDSDCDNVETCTSTRTGTAIAQTRRAPCGATSRVRAPGGPPPTRPLMIVTTRTRSRDPAQA